MSRKDVDEVGGIYAALPEMFAVPGAQAAWSKFIEAQYPAGIQMPKISPEPDGSMKAPEGFVFAVVRFMGRAQVVALPQVSAGRFGAVTFDACSGPNTDKDGCALSVVLSNMTLFYKGQGCKEGTLVCERMGEDTFTIGISQF